MDRSRIILFLTLATLIATSLMPRRFLGWANDAASLLHIPVAPVSHMGTLVASWMRPATTPFENLPGNVRDQFAQMAEERDRFERLYQQSEHRAAELEEQVRQLQKIDLAQRPDDLKLLFTSITGRHPSDQFAAVRVKGGSRASVVEGSVAVYGGVHLLGQVTDVDKLGSTVRPAANKETPPLRARVWPRDRPETTSRGALPVRLVPGGDGLFLADVDKNADVAVGDVVRLVDPAWPEAAQLLTIGVVDSIRPKDQQPLRNEIVVRPAYQVHEVASVLLMIQPPTLAETELTNAGGDR